MKTKKARVRGCIGMNPSLQQRRKAPQSPNAEKGKGPMNSAGQIPSNTSKSSPNPKKKEAKPETGQKGSNTQSDTPKKAAQPSPKIATPQKGATPQKKVPLQLAPNKRGPVEDRADLTQPCEATPSPKKPAKAAAGGNGTPQVYLHHFPPHE